MWPTDANILGMIMSYDHALNNYRLALKDWRLNGSKANPIKQTKMWNRVLGNALRLAESVDRSEQAAAKNAKEVPPEASETPPKKHKNQELAGLKPSNAPNKSNPFNITVFPETRTEIRELLIENCVCPECGKELDTGWECNSCKFDAYPEDKKLLLE